MEIQDVEESNYQKTWIMCPSNAQQILNIKLPFLVIILKSTHTQFHFQLQILDKEKVKHYIHFSNIEQQKNSVIKSKSTVPRVHLILDPGWNKIEVDLSHLSKIFEAQFESICRLKICGNCRIRRVYCTDRHYDDNEMSLTLYQGFLDYYMSKWGINAVERATQTKKTTTGKPVAKDISLHPTNGFNKLFLRNLQAKSDKIIEEFFSKQPIKSIKDYLDFKRKAKIKPYVIPDNSKMNKNTKNSDSSLIDLQEIKKNFSQDNYLYGKLAFEEKNKKYNKRPESKSEKREARYSVYKIHKYKYPEIIERKKSTGKTDKSKSTN